MMMHAQYPLPVYYSQIYPSRSFVVWVISRLAADIHKCMYLYVLITGNRVSQGGASLYADYQVKNNMFYHE